MLDHLPSKNKSKLDLYFSVIDYWLIVPVFIASVIGLFVLSKVLSSGYDGTGQIMFIKQAGAVIVGMTIALIIAALEAPMLKIVAYAVYGLSVILLVVVLVDTYDLTATTGSDSWLMLPLIGSFQPSELAKIGIIMLSAFYLADIREGKISTLKGMAIVLGIYALPLLLIAKQPDLGTILMIVVIISCMLFVYGIPYKYIFLLVSLGIAAIPVAWAFYLQPYQKNRILTFLYPGFSPSQDFHVKQAQMAIKSGGIIGSKLGSNIIVPVKESDFIYTAVAEILGFIGTTVLVCALFFIIIRGLWLSKESTNNSLKYMATGIATMFGIHTVQNLGMCVGLIPITGIPLPFVSLGGSAMIVNFFALGILLCISIETNMLRETSNI